MAKHTSETAELVALLERGGVDALRRRLGITPHQAQQAARLLRRAALEGRELSAADIPRGTTQARRQSVPSGDRNGTAPPLVPAQETPDPRHVAGARDWRASWSARSSSRARSPAGAAVVWTSSAPASASGILRLLVASEK
jgi:hypothetical protein